ncbi:MAG TPA: DUF3341 domain-containing protein [Cyclobacteriaceae bacterium]|nr:DUF3341 domain-containing protein [Cyclobacteriaceae bacterium]
MNKSIIGIYDNENLLISVLNEMDKENISIEEVYSPYPIHEVFKILKRKTKLPYATFTYALIGLAISYSFLYWASVKSYPLIYGGKPLHSIPSFIIICFVSMISISMLLSVLTFLARTKLYPGKRPMIHDLKITDDAFVMIIPKKPEMSENDLIKINSLLKASGAIKIIEK